MTGLNSKYIKVQISLTDTLCHTLIESEKVIEIIIAQVFPREGPSYKMGRVFFVFWHKSPSGAFNACARYKCVCKMGQCAEPEFRALGCLRHGEQRHLYSVYKTQGPQE